MVIARAFADANLVARNVATHIDREVLEKPREWTPLVYCWRGGQRSRALAHVLNEIGWRAVQLEGGYRAYRRYVVAELAALPWRFAPAQLHRKLLGLGDLALHITYLRNFALGVPLWPENPIYLLSSVRYPAGIDLFNALLFLIHIDLRLGLTWVGLLASAGTFYAFWRW